MKKTWFITGASSGIGRLLTEKVLEQGDRVIATLRKMDVLKELTEKYPERLELIHLELTDKNEIKETVENAFEIFDEIDVVVSNAGYGLFGAAEELTDDMIEHQIEVNLLGSIRFIKAMIPSLRKQSKRSHIIQVSSEGGQIAYPGFSLYHASKWGVEGFVESVSKELAPFDIHFSIVEPGPTDTSFGANVALAEVMECYKETPVGDLRTLLAEGFGELDDVNDVIAAILDLATKNNPPFRIATGKVARTHLKAAYEERLALLKENMN